MAYSQNPYVDPLIALYGQDTAQAIDGNAALIQNAFGRSLSELAADPNFTGANHAVNEMRRRFDTMHRTVIEKGVGDQLVANCLFCLLDEALNRNAQAALRIYVLGNLLRTIYESGWSDRQKKHFGFWSERIQGWNSCFFSYTNQSVTGLNSAYKKVVQALLPSDRRTQKARDNNNLVAEALVNELRSHNISSFFDKTAIGNGDNLEKTIESGCKTTFVFLQLIHKETFTAAGQNWCHLEYKTFGATNKNLIDEMVTYFSPLTIANRSGYEQFLDTRLRSAMAEDRKVFPLQLQPDYQPWQRDMTDTKRYESLARDVDAFQQAAMAIAQKIVYFKRELMRVIPT